MKANKVETILAQLTNDCDDFINVVIDGTNFTTTFTISAETRWSINTEGCLLTLETIEGTEFIDTDSITRISI